MNHDGVIQCPDQAALNGEADGTGTVAALQLELERSRRKLGQLQDQLAQTEGLIAHVADAIFVVEHEGRIVDANPAASALLGYTREEFLTMCPWNFVTSVPRGEILATIESLKNGEPLAVKRVCRAKNGEEKVMALRLRRNDVGGRDLVMVTARDVTQEQHAAANLENALKEIKRSEIELRAIVDALPAHAWCSREDGYNIYCNQQWLDYSGLTQETARGWSYRDKLHPDDVGAFVSKWNEVSKTGAPMDAEVRFRRHDGVYRWFLIRAVPVRDASGNIVKWFGTNTDIDDRKRTELLRATERRALEMIADGASLTDILNQLCSSIDVQVSPSVTTVLLTDPDGKRLWPTAGPRVPREWISTISPVPIAVEAGLCGTAACVKKRVIVTDVATDPNWPDSYRDLAIRNGIRAGWSQPILTKENQVLGTFAFYSSESRMPTEADLALIEGGARIALIAIERQRSLEALQASERLARGQAEALTLVLDALSRETDPDQTVEHVLRTVTAQLVAHSSSVWLRDEASGLMVFEFALEEGKFKTKTEATIAKISPSLPVHAIIPWPEIFRTGKPSVLEDIREGPDFPWRAHVLAQGIVTILVVPMMVVGEVQGVIGVRFTQKRTFRVEELELAKALANQAMLAIQLARLSTQSRQSAIIEERNRMARDIHDTLAQGFTGVILHTEAAEEAMSRKRMDVVSGHLRGAGEIARDGLREARRSVRALRPLALEEKKLAQALEELILKLTVGTAVQATFKLQGEPRDLPPETETNFLRIGQEALTNAIRHARPTKIDVLLAFSERELRLSMCDNGCGFDPNLKSSGFGLQGMAERAEGMGGQFSIQSASGKGTTISVTIPLPVPTEPEKS